MKKIKFSLQALQAMPDYATLKKVVSECDQLGFDSAWVSDHLQFTYGPTLECWTVLADRSIKFDPHHVKKVQLNKTRANDALPKFYST